MKPEILIFREVSSGSSETGLDGISFYVRQGEVLGFYGLDAYRKYILFELILNPDTEHTGMIQRPYLSLPLNSGRYPEAVKPTAVIIGDKILESKYGISLVNEMTVWENLYALTPNRHRGLLLNERHAIENTKNFLHRFGIRIDPERYIFELSQTERYMLEILKARLIGAAIIILDDYNFRYSLEEYNALADLISALKADGVSFLHFSKSKRIFNAMADRLLICNEGNVLKCLNAPIDWKIVPAELTEEKSLMETERQPDKTFRGVKSEVLSVHGVAVDENRYHLTLNKGEFTILCDPNRRVSRAIETAMTQNVPETDIFYNGKHVRNLFEQFQKRKIVSETFLLSRHGSSEDYSLIEEMSLSDNLCLDFFPRVSSWVFIKNSSTKFVKKEFEQWSGSRIPESDENCFHLTTYDKIAVMLYRLYLNKPEVIFCKSTKLLRPDENNLVKSALSELSHQYGAAICYITYEVGKFIDCADRYLEVGEDGTITEERLERGRVKES